MEFEIYQDGTLKGSGESPVSIDGLTPDTLYPAGTFIAKYKGESEITVVPSFRTDPLEGATLDISPQDQRLSVGQSTLLKVTNLPEEYADGKSNTWVVREEGLSTIKTMDDGSLAVTAIKEGQLTLKVRIPNGMFGYAHITILPDVIDYMTVTATASRIPVGNSVMGIAKIFPENLPQEVTWKCQPISAGRMSQDGVFTANTNTGFVDLIATSTYDVTQFGQVRIEVYQPQTLVMTPNTDVTQVKQGIPLSFVNTIDGVRTYDELVFTVTPPEAGFVDKISRYKGNFSYTGPVTITGTKADGSTTVSTVEIIQNAYESSKVPLSMFVNDENTISKGEEFSIYALGNSSNDIIDWEQVKINLENDVVSYKYVPHSVFTFTTNKVGSCKVTVSYYDFTKEFTIIVK